jgi:hypothetical protein
MATMPNHRLARSAHRTAVRRRTTWARSIGTLSNAAAGTYDTVDLLGQFKTAGGTTFGCTVARIHLRLSQVSVPTIGDELGIGIIKGQDTDVGVTIAGAPQPVTHPYEDWLWWSVFFACDQPGAGSHMFPGGSGCYEVDVRAKRKLEDLDECLNLVSVNPVAGTFPAQFDYSASVLLMLP